MKKLIVVLYLVFSMISLFADTEVTAYQLWLKVTEKPEKINIGMLVKDEGGLLPGCEDCEYCAQDQSQEGCEECAEKGCEWPYGYYDYDEVAGEVYRAKFDSLNNLMEVVEINFDDYFDECVAPGYYEYLKYKNFPYTHCQEAVSNYDGHRPECINFIGITVPEHSEVCPAQSKVTMTQEEFESMKFVPYSDEDSEINDTQNDEYSENDDVENDEDAESNDSATDDNKDDVEIYDNDIFTEQSEESVTAVDGDNESEKPDTSGKTDSDGCSLLII